MDAQIIEKGFERVWKLFEETDRKFQETDLLIKELSKKVDSTSQEVTRMSQEVAKTSREVKRVSDDLGRLGNRLGEFIEYLIKPALVKLFQTRGIEVHSVHRDIEVNNATLNMAMQIDLLVVNTLICILVEAKSHLSVDDVNEHLERMGKFKNLLPEYQKHQVIGAVAGMVMADDVARYAYRKGFFVIGQKGETAVILNDEKFKPTIW